MDCIYWLSGMSVVTSRVGLATVSRGEGIDFASAILVAVEHTVFITSQGIGGDADLADGFGLRR